MTDDQRVGDAAALHLGGKITQIQVIVVAVQLGIVVAVKAVTLLIGPCDGGPLGGDNPLQRIGKGRDGGRQRCDLPQIGQRQGEGIAGAAAQQGGFGGQPRFAQGAPVAIIAHQGQQLVIGEASK